MVKVEEIKKLSEIQNNGMVLVICKNEELIKQRLLKQSSNCHYLRFIVQLHHYDCDLQ